MKTTNKYMLISKNISILYYLMMISIILLVIYWLLNCYLYSSNAMTSYLVAYIISGGVVCLFFKLLSYRILFISILIQVSIICWGIYEAIYGCLQLYGYAESNNYLYKLTGSFHNPGPYAGFLATILPLLLQFFLQKSSIKNKWFRLPMILLCNIGILLFLSILPATMSRAAWLAAILGSGVVLAKYYKLYDRLRLLIAKHKIITASSFFILGLLVLALCIGIYYLKKDSADGRLLMWKVTTRIIVDNPWFGVGIGGFSGAYGKAQAAYFASGEATEQEEYLAGSPEYAFNEFLQIAAETGLIGLLLFWGILYVSFRMACKCRQWGVVGSLFALLTFSCFSYPFSIWQHMLLLVLLLAMCGNNRQEFHRRVDYRMVIILSIVLFLSIIWAALKWHEEQKSIEAWKEEQTYYNMAIYEGTVDNYQRLYPCLREDPRFLFEYGHCLSKTGKYEQSNIIMHEGAERSSDPMFWNIIGKNHQAMGDYKQAEKCFQYASLMVPHRLYPIYLLANLYFESNDIEKALQTAHRVIEKRPKVMSAAIDEMKAEMKEKIETYQNIQL